MKQFIKIVGFCFISSFLGAQGYAQTQIEDLYTHKVQPIFDNRCVACHSCFNAPCQLNLQNFDGFARGANKLNVYDGTRTKSVEPSRIWVDASTTEQWRMKQFFTVHSSQEPQENLFFQMLKLREQNPQFAVKKQVHESQVCAANMTEFKAMAQAAPELGMPYGFPALVESDMKILESWIKNGAPGPSKKMLKEQAQIEPVIQKQIKEWEAFFNEKDLKHRLVSRYLYEHLFLAHIYFPENNREFFRLVRSKNKCSDIEEIATRRPNDDPGVNKVWYCLRKFPGTVVMKNHLPYEWNAAKLKRYQELFFANPWEIKAMPSYDPQVAENPFLVFEPIPVKARYQFLLDDAQYHVATFIKGPVCNGSMAVNSIQEQFYAFFIKPESDNMVLSSSYEEKAAKLLMLPGVWGSDVELIDTPIFLKRLTDHREGYRKLRDEELKKNRPQGYSLQDIWDGDGSNTNAVLTIFRHDQNAVVMRGAVGDLSKTVFMLDYPLFERLVYNLVVNFDVFGNVSHQLLTRIYMDMIRMEAEEMFLRFLPPEQRLSYRREWYQGLLASAKMAYLFPTVGVGEPTAVRYAGKTRTKKQLVQKILYYQMNAQVRGPEDIINWKDLEVPESAGGLPGVRGVEAELRKMASVPAKKKPFSQFFPDVAYLIVRGEKNRVFTVIHNREHENISWITGESFRMAPNEDTLTLREGFWGSYPNMIFDVKEADLAKFSSKVRAMKESKDYDALVKAYGVQRTHSGFWGVFDELQKLYTEKDPINAGVIDLTRYSL